MRTTFFLRDTFQVVFFLLQNIFSDTIACGWRQVVSVILCGWLRAGNGRLHRLLNNQNTFHKHCVVYSCCHHLTPAATRACLSFTCRLPEPGCSNRSNYLFNIPRCAGCRNSGVRCRITDSKNIGFLVSASCGPRYCNRLSF